MSLWTSVIKRYMIFKVNITTTPLILQAPISQKNDIFNSPTIWLYPAPAFVQNVGLMIKDGEIFIEWQWEIDMWLLLYINRKLYMESPTASLELKLSDIERSNSKSFRFPSLYIVYHKEAYLG